jgi:hypothetical protein
MDASVHMIAGTENLLPASHDAFADMQKFQKANSDASFPDEPIGSSPALSWVVLVVSLAHYLGLATWIPRLGHLGPRSDSSFKPDRYVD